MPADHVMFVGLRGRDYPRVAALPWTLSAIVREGSSHALPPEALRCFSAFAGFTTTGDPADLTAYETSHQQISEQANGVIRRLGVPRGVVGLYEHTVLPAARLRQALGVPGLQPRTVDLCRDKVAMKHAMHSGGISIPDFRVLPDARTPESDATLKAFFDVAGASFVVKPRRQAAAMGIHIVDSFDALSALRDHVVLTDYEIETFVPGEVLHVDGVVRGRRPLSITASRYLHPPLSFGRQDVALGSSLVSDPELRRRIEDRTRAVLSTVDVADTVFHLEMILTPSSDLVFLELACRMGGGEIDWLHREVLGIDLVQESILAGANAPSPLSRRGGVVRVPRTEHAAWLMMPFPASGPGKVTAVEGLCDLPGEVIATDLPSKGDMLTRTSVRPTSGSFLLRAPNESSLRRALDTVTARYRVHTA